MDEPILSHDIKDDWILYSGPLSGSGEPNLNILQICSPKYKCPKCEYISKEYDLQYITITIKGYEGKYCMVCYAKFLSENIPKLVEIEEDK